MRILIVGGGNLGHASAAILSNRDNVTIDLLTNNPKKWSRNFAAYLPDGDKIIGRIDNVSDRPDELVPMADIIFLCLPALYIENVLKTIKPFLRKDTIIGSVVGNTGFFIYCHNLLSCNTKLFSFQRVPYVSRIIEYGRSVNLLGYRKKLIMAVENIEDKDSFCVQIESLFGEETVLANDYYEVTLSNSNPILHTGRLYSMWKG